MHKRCPIPLVVNMDIIRKKGRQEGYYYQQEQSWQSESMWSRLKELLKKSRGLC